MSSKAKDDLKLPADGIIRDPLRKAQYKKGKFLGKGGFAKVYELTCVESGQLYAGKIVPKTLLQKGHQKQKMAQEISIHKSLMHKHIVEFVSHFEDEFNVYIVLEICRKRTLMELHRRRKTVTEPEARYFMHQICESLLYLHGNSIVHRDLKLGNLLLNDDLEIKLGDFGLAARIGKPGDRKMTMCGTPNYIAPEVLLKKGHSYEVDIWALGCILYTLLVGHPPFETDNLNETYARIKKNKYSIPESLERSCPSAVDLIKKMLKDEPLERPTIVEIMNSKFCTEYRPKTLPGSCLTMAPRCDTVSLMNETALKQHFTTSVPLQPSRTAAQARVNTNDGLFAKPAPPLERNPLRDGMKENESGRVVTASRPMLKDAAGAPSVVRRDVDKVPAPSELLVQLQNQLQKLFNASPKVPFGRDSPAMDEAEDPSLAPMLWISKWVDYSDKYGLGYQLSDDSFGVLFNDKTRLILLPNGHDLHYVARDWAEQYHNIEQFPPNLSKKVKLISYFKDYMNERLVKAGAKHAKNDGDALARYPFMMQWFRSNQCILMMLSNGTIQMNYFEDHVKIILCPLMQAVTYLHSGNDFRTFSFSALAENGCTVDLYNRLKDAYHLVQKLMTQNLRGEPAPLSSQPSSKNLAVAANPVR